MRVIPMLRKLSKRFTSSRLAPRLCLRNKYKIRA